MLRSGIDRSYDYSIFSFLRNLQTVFQSCYNNLWAPFLDVTRSQLIWWTIIVASIHCLPFLLLIVESSEFCSLGGKSVESPKPIFFMHLSPWLPPPYQAVTEEVDHFPSKLRSEIPRNIHVDLFQTNYFWFLLWNRSSPSPWLSVSITLAEWFWFLYLPFLLISKKRLTGWHTLKCNGNFCSAPWWISSSSGSQDF